MALSARFSNGQVLESGHLYEHLRHLFSKLGVSEDSRSPLSLKALNEEGSIFECMDGGSGSSLVCKFFGARLNVPETECRNLLDHEYHCLHEIRMRGFDRFPFFVVKPLVKLEEMEYLLVEEFVEGKSLDHFIGRAAHDRKDKRLFQKLDLLAEFLARLHLINWTFKPVSFGRIAGFFRSMAKGLRNDNVFDEVLSSRLLHLCDKWEGRMEMWASGVTLVHGDATPTNFIVTPEDGVTAIDFERMGVGDPIYDVGLFASELKHHFALRIHDSNAAEPYISHFLYRYCQRISGGDAHFSELTFRSRFYMALGELRIARNPWLPLGHRRWLGEEAERCLQ